jgi:hypothetical protein
MDFTKDVRETIGRYNRNIVAALGADRFSLYATADKFLILKCPLDYGRHPVFPSYGLGILERLPLEIQQMVLLQSDVQSFLVFRAVS